MSKSLLVIFLSVFMLNACHTSTSLDAMREVAFNDNSQPIKINASNRPQKISSVPIPDEVTFAGERIPIERDDVKEALEQELMVITFRHSKTIKLIKNMQRWQPFITNILKEKQVPVDFIYLAVAESEFDNTATSGVGAEGMWQFMARTAKEKKLKINKDVDMRRDPKLATIAAGEYLKKSYKHFDNWLLSAASYNRGVRGVQKRMDEQRVTSFFDLHLNQETSRYVYRIVAFKLILENPTIYGYDIKENEKYRPYEFNVVEVTEDIDDLIEFAKQYNTTYKELRKLNPWFNNTSAYRLNVERNEVYELRVPVNKNITAMN